MFMLLMVVSKVHAKTRRTKFDITIWFVGHVRRGCGSAAYECVNSAEMLQFLEQIFMLSISNV